MGHRALALALLASNISAANGSAAGEILRERYARSKASCTYGSDGQLIRVKEEAGQGHAAMVVSGTPAQRFRSVLEGLVNTTEARRRLSAGGSAAATPPSDVIGKTLDIVNAVEADLSDETLQLVFDDDVDVSDVEANCRVVALQTQFNPIWGLDRIGQCRAALSTSAHSRALPPLRPPLPPRYVRMPPPFPSPSRLPPLAPSRPPTTCPSSRLS